MFKTRNSRQLVWVTSSLCYSSVQFICVAKGEYSVEVDSQIRRVAVLGAGVMGAQIAAHMVNAGFDTFLYDLPSPKGEPNSIVNQALKQLKKLKPSPLAISENVDLIIPKNYQDHLSDLSQCDLIIEAVAERFDIKASLYEKISPHLSHHAVLVSNTSGLSINKLSELLPPSLQTRFCGVHFFNPPRYMPLLELIPSDKTDKNLLDKLEAFFVSFIGKGVVRAKDTPNFIANRIGVFSMLCTLHHAEALDIPLDTVDALTGALIGRPKSATFRTMDVVGLDTMKHVVQTMTEQLEADPWHAYFKVPSWMNQLIEEGALGQKTRKGIYQKVGKTIQVLDVHSHEYVDASPKLSEEIQSILKEKDLKQRFKLLRSAKGKEAAFLWACFRDLFHYCAYHLDNIATNTRDIDLAIRFGFAWQVGPFETWQLAGLDEIRKAIQADITGKASMSEASLPSWLDNLDAFYTKEGAYAPTVQKPIPRSSLPVYKRQITFDKVLGEEDNLGQTLFENEAVRLWTLDNTVAIVSFKSKANCIGEDILEGLNQAIDKAEACAEGLVIWQTSSQYFSAGANLKQFMSLFEVGQEDALRNIVYQFQRTLLRLKYTSLPVVAALRGQALGGGCELLMHCDDAVCALESYVGLVEIGVGLLPASGGLKELANRAVTLSKANDAFSLLERYFKMVAMAEVSSSGVDAKKRDFLKPTATVIMNTNEVLYTAIQKAHYLIKSNYRPPMHSLFPVLGRDAVARLNMIIVNMHAGGFISDHDKYIAEKIAYVIAGGDLNVGECVDEEWFLRLEIDAFLALAATDKTKARVSHLMKTGKPLRN